MRYLHDYGYGRETLGCIALNSRTNAAANPNAVFREPMTMADYLDGRMVRDPLCVYDMDVPIDGADAFVVTTTERARDLPQPPVLVHAATLGHTDYGSEEQLRDLDHAGQVVVAAASCGPSPTSASPTSTSSTPTRASPTSRSAGSRTSATAIGARAARSWPSTGTRRSSASSSTAACR